jgi:hypothetical protein
LIRATCHHNGDAARANQRQQQLQSYGRLGQRARDGDACRIAQSATRHILRTSANDPDAQQPKILSRFA